MHTTNFLYYSGPLLPVLTQILVTHTEEHEAYAILTSIVKRSESFYMNSTPEEDETVIIAFHQILEKKISNKLFNHLMKNPHSTTFMTPFKHVSIYFILYYS